MNLDAQIEILKSGKCIEERDLRLICEKIKEILIEESNV